MSSAACRVAARGLLLSLALAQGAAASGDDRGGRDAEMVCVPAADGRSWACGTRADPPPERGFAPPPRGASAPPPPFLAAPGAAMAPLAPARTTSARAPRDAFPPQAGRSATTPAGEVAPAAPPAAAEVTPLAEPERAAIAPAGEASTPAAPIAEAPAAAPAQRSAAPAVSAPPPMLAAPRPRLAPYAPATAPTMAAAPAAQARAPTESTAAAPAAREAIAAPDAPPAPATPVAAIADAEPEPPGRAPAGPSPAPDAPPESEIAQQPAGGVDSASGEPPMPAAPPAAPAPVVDAPPSPAPAIEAPTLADRDAFLALPADRATLQLARAARLGELYAAWQRLVAASGGALARGTAYIVTLDAGGAPQALLLWSDFADAAAARAAWDALPGFADGKPAAYARRVAPLQDEIRRSTSNR